MGSPVLVGLSRKSMLGLLTEQLSIGVVYASIAAAMLAIQRGRPLFGPGDVRANRDAIKVMVRLVGEQEVFWNRWCARASGRAPDYA